MKTIKLTNSEVVPLYKVLENITVEGRKPRRGKGKLQKALMKKNEEYVKDLKDIQSDYFKKKEDGSFVTDGETLVWMDNYKDDPKAKHDFRKQVKELNEEEIGLDLVEHESKLKAFFDALEADEFEGKEDLRDDDFDTLLDKLEDVFKEEN